MNSGSVARRAKRFGEVVRARREELGLTPERVVALGGPVDSTLRSIEIGAVGRERRMSTLNKLDDPLRWVPGSAARTYGGGDPIPIEELGAAPLRMATDGVVMTPTELVKLVELNTIMDRLHDVAAEDKPLAEALGSLNVLTGNLIARYVTSVLEQNGGPGNVTPSVLTMALAHHMEAPARGDALEEGLYRRFLFNPGLDLDDETRERFTARWRAAGAIADSARSKDGGAR